MGEAIIIIGVILIICIRIGIVIVRWRRLGVATTWTHGTRRPFPGWVYLVIGFVVLLGAGVSWVRTLHFAHDAIRTSGTIIEMRQGKGEYGRIERYAPTFRFQDAEGRQHTVSSKFYSSQEFHSGEIVAVLYLADNPQTARIDSFWQMWGLSSCAGIFGSICLTIGVVVVFWPRTFGRLRE
jgi:hypothetical protein